MKKRKWIAILIIIMQVSVMPIIAQASGMRSTDAEEEEELLASLPELESMDLDTRLQPLFDKIDFPFHHYSDDIKEFLIGTWNGEPKVDVNDEMYCGRFMLGRTYYWLFIGSERITGKINIDYEGPFDVVSGTFFTLAVDYSTGNIEKWRALEKEDSWQLQLNEGEKIDDVFALGAFKEEADCQAIVRTFDESAQKHMYFLMPDGEIKKIS